MSLNPLVLFPPDMCVRSLFVSMSSDIPLVFCSALTCMIALLLTNIDSLECKIPFVYALGISRVSFFRHSGILLPSPSLLSPYRSWFDSSSQVASFLTTKFVILCLPFNLLSVILWSSSIFRQAFLPVHPIPRSSFRSALYVQLTCTSWWYAVGTYFSRATW